MKDNYNEENLVELLKQSLKPAKPDWSTNREVLEAVLLKDQNDANRVKRARWMSYSWIGSIGIVAILILTFVFVSSTGPQKTGVLNEQQFAQGSEYRAVGAQENLIGMEDMGWTEYDEDTVTREYKYDYVDTVDLVNEEDGSVIRLQVPRQEIVNVKYQVI